MDVTELRKRLQTYDQEHLLNFWNDLKEDEKKALYQELNQLDLDYVTQSFERCVSSMEAKAEKLDDHMAPLPSKFEKSVLPTHSDFLSLRFYVKSILENVKVQKMPFLPF